MTAVLFAVAGAVAIVDWLAVWRRRFRVEYLAKPLTLALLVAAAASADLPNVKVWVVAALVFGLIGDVALMVGADRPGRPDDAFLAGLAAFLVGHICYLVAFARHGLHGVTLLAGVLVVIGSAGLTSPRILMHTSRIGGTQLSAVIGGYATVLAAMTVLAVGTSSVLTALGGLLFLGSDTVIAWDRFVARLARGPLLVIVSYHLAQFLIVLGLLHHS